MEVRSVSCCLEPFISRIPGLFAYTQKNGAGISELHKASDREGGCYGMIPENLRLPVPLPTGDKDGEVVSYRTMMYYYYKYRPLLPDSNPFIQFVERGIGKRKIDGFTDEQDLVPSYFYLSFAKNEYLKMSQMKLMHEYYLKSDDKSNRNLILKSQEYERSGGDKMMDLLKGFIDEASAIADEFYGYSEGLQDTEKNSWHIPLLLNSDIEDEGMLSPCIEEWNPKKVYYRGDIVYYNYHSWLCIKETSGMIDPDCNLKVFDTNSFIINDAYKFPILKIQGIDWDGNATGQAGYSSAFNISFPIKLVADADTDYTISGITDSKLTGLRRYSSYINNATNAQEEPEEGTDWMFYYRVGYVCDYETSNDNLGNIMHQGPDMENGDDLYAYGDVITAITPNQGDRTITFEYWIGAHLKADFIRMEEDQDGNKLYYYGKFRIDTKTSMGKYHGVKYTETYIYDEGSDLDNLVNSGTFDQYISGDNDDSDNTKYEFRKGVETTIEHNRYTDGSELFNQYDATHFEVLVENKPDYIYAQLYKKEYLYGIHDIKKDVDVFIDRGNNALFEKRMKLLELQSVSDLEKYANGGFFSIQQMS